MDYNIAQLHKLNAPFAPTGVSADKRSDHLGMVAEAYISGDEVAISRPPLEVHRSKELLEVPSCSATSSSIPAVMYEHPSRHILSALPKCTAGCIHSPCLDNSLCLMALPERDQPALIELTESSQRMQPQCKHLPLALKASNHDDVDKDVSITRENHSNQACVQADEHPRCCHAISAPGGTREQCKKWLQCIPLVPARPQTTVRMTCAQVYILK
jgi:hypothetical protein